MKNKPFCCLSLSLLMILQLGLISVEGQVQTETVPPSGTALAVEEVVTLPDSASGANPQPRINVITVDPANRLFANDQRGPLYYIDEDAGTFTEYLDLTDDSDIQLVFSYEGGFQSFAFHPDFFDKTAEGYGRFYTIHSDTNTAGTPDFDPGGNTSFHTLLLEWRTDTPSAIPFSPADAENPYRELMRLKQPFGNHNSGLIAFNASVPAEEADYGNLYIAIGDGGSGDDPQDNGQDAGNPYGAILRIDPLGSDSANGQYGIVGDNVLAADDDASTLAEIYAYGLRNPQRFSWDIVTGEMYLADIGQDAVEEINQVVNGGNYGWADEEGSAENPPFIDPIAEYPHNTNLVDPMPTTIGNRAVTCGDVIRGACIPHLEGKLVSADFPTGLIFLVDIDNGDLDGGIDEFTELLLLNDQGNERRFIELMNAARAERSLGSRSRADLRFSVNTPGRVYLVNKGDGIIRRITPTAEPTLTWTAPSQAELELTFTGTLVTTTDLGEQFTPVIPQPRSPWTREINPATDPPMQFWRTIRP